MLRGAWGAMAVGTAARVERHLSRSYEGEDEIAADVAALCAGAAALSQLGSRDDSVRLLLAAVAISPSDLRAHRRLAAALANSGDRAAAADEYTRYITVVRKRGDAKRADLEVEYARAALSVTLRALPTPAAPRPMVEPQRIAVGANRGSHRTLRWDLPIRSLVTTIFATIAISCLGAAIGLGVSLVLGHR
jgi:tetratricopeptide (TPR) repeat protein